MTIGGWVYNRIINDLDTNTIISGNCFPFYSTETIFPSVSYGIISQKNNLICRLPIITIRCNEKTQDKCEILNENLYKLFDCSTQVICETSGGIKIEGIEIVNNIPSLYDFDNNLWHGILDIRVSYVN